MPNTFAEKKKKKKTSFASGNFGSYFVGNWNGAQITVRLYRDESSTVLGSWYTISISTCTMYQMILLSNKSVDRVTILLWKNDGTFGTNTYSILSIVVG